MTMTSKQIDDQINELRGSTLKKSAALDKVIGIYERMREILLKVEGIDRADRSRARGFSRPRPWL